MYQSEGSKPRQYLTQEVLGTQKSRPEIWVEGNSEMLAFLMKSAVDMRKPSFLSKSTVAE